jgi:hypothetical protein
MCRHVIEGMRERKFGRIVNIGSVNGQAGQYGQVNYAAAKSGIHGFTKALAQEGAKVNVTVNAVAPGYVNTDMVRAVPEKVLEKIIERIPVGRLGETDDIVRAVLFLVADERQLHDRLDHVRERRPAHVLTAAAQPGLHARATSRPRSARRLAAPAGPGGKSPARGAAGAGRPARARTPGRDAAAPRSAAAAPRRGAPSRPPRPRPGTAPGRCRPASGACSTSGRARG